MTNDDTIRTQMTAAGMLMEDLSARLILKPLDPELPGQLRLVAAALIDTANRVDALRGDFRFNG